VGQADALSELFSRKSSRGEVLHSMRNSLSTPMPKMRVPNPPETKFCAQCASSLIEDQARQSSNAAGGPALSDIRVAADSPEPRSLEGERKTVTALFADIKGSMELDRGQGCAPHWSRLRRQSAEESSRPCRASRRSR
jgi:hypothetical protein